jgi:hypothetical protein
VIAALAVCAINVLIEFGSNLGTGVTALGAQARIKKRAANQRNKFLRGKVMAPLADMG